jgi:hypothetical protein
MAVTAERDKVQERTISATDFVSGRSSGDINRSVAAKCRPDIRPVCARFLVNRMALRGALCTVLLTECYLGDQIKNEMGCACGTYVGAERFILGVGGKTSEKETTWKT